MIQVKIITGSNGCDAEQGMNAWLAANAEIEIVDIKVGNDGHSIYTYYVIIYKV